MSTKQSIRQQLELAAAGFPADESCFFFYDWFCKDKALPLKSKLLLGKVRKFLKIFPTIDIDRTYLFFKNNCPCNGSLYDDFRICDLESGDVIYTVIPSSGHRGKGAELWGRENDFKGPILEADSWKELLAKMRLHKPEQKAIEAVVEPTPAQEVLITEAGESETVAVAA